jgi:hypothetical protein
MAPMGNSYSLQARPAPEKNALEHKRVNAQDAENPRMNFTLFALLSERQDPPPTPSLPLEKKMLEPLAPS